MKKSVRQSVFCVAIARAACVMAGIAFVLGGGAPVFAQKKAAGSKATESGAKATESGAKATESGSKATESGSKDDTTSTEDDEPYRVAIHPIAPFVTQEGKELSGFSVVLWNTIVRELKAKSVWVRQVPEPETEATPDKTSAKPAPASPKPGESGGIPGTPYRDDHDILTAVSNGEADLAIGAITITSQRYENYDFSTPIYESGLQIMIRTNDVRRLPLLGVLKSIFTPATIQLTFFLLFILLIFAHIVWFLERKDEEGLVEGEKYFPGIFKALWWGFGTLLTQSQEQPRGGFARCIAIFWMFAGVAYVSVITANLTSDIALNEFRGRTINSEDDLGGKTIATVITDSSKTYFKDTRVHVQEFKTFGEACDALISEKVDAVVAASPLLLYYQAHHGGGKVQVVGSVFHRENYAIAFPRNSPYRRDIDDMLLSLREDGTYDELLDTWFNSQIEKQAQIENETKLTTGQ